MLKNLNALFIDGIKVNSTDYTKRVKGNIDLFIPITIIEYTSCQKSRE